MARTTTAGAKNGVAGKSAFENSTGTRAAARPVTVVAEGKPGASATQARTASPTARPSHDQICRRAYEIYLERCQRGQPGSAQGDWVQAEAELM